MAPTLNNNSMRIPRGTPTLAAFRSSACPRRWLSSKPVFFDMVHSNNAARVRLWMQLKKPGGMEEAIESRIVKYPDLQTAEFAALNPLKKVPALIRADGTTVFESNASGPIFAVEGTVAAARLVWRKA